MAHHKIGGSDTQSLYEYEFGKNETGQWFWRCTCGCNTVAGPFTSGREAEENAQATAERDVAMSECGNRVH
jgi:hypothetical protein